MNKFWPGVHSIIKSIIKPESQPQASTIRYLSVNGPSELERLPGGHTSILLLDANVYGYLIAHKKNSKAFAFSSELDELLRIVHHRQILVDASFAAMERAVGTSKLLAEPEEFAKWFTDFYAGDKLFKVNSIKPATCSVGTPRNYQIAAHAWEIAFLPAFATLLKAFEIASRRPRRSQFLVNFEDLITWGRAEGVAPGLAANLAIDLFAKEPVAMETLKYNGGDSWARKVKRAHNAARDVMYYIRLLAIANNCSRDTGGAALYATADAGFFHMVRLNKLNYWTITNEHAIYACDVYPELEQLLSPDERVVVSATAFDSPEHVPAALPPNELAALITALSSGKA
jgi:hypothetical protein